MHRVQNTNVWSGQRGYDGLGQEIRPMTDAQIDEFLKQQLIQQLLGATVGAFLAGISFALATKIIPVSIKREGSRRSPMKRRGSSSSKKRPR